MNLERMVARATTLTAKGRPKLAARSLVTVPRVPLLDPRTYKGMFQTAGSVVIDCPEDGCGWHALVPRGDIKKAVDDHKRQWHAAAAEQNEFVTFINRPRQ